MPLSPAASPPSLHSRVRPVARLCRERDSDHFLVVALVSMLELLNTLSGELEHISGVGSVKYNDILKSQ